MPGLTVTEKEHWKNRIGHRLDKKIDGLFATEPNLQDRVQREARTRALQSLGLADLQTELDRLKAEEQAFERRQQRLELQLLARVRGVDIEDLEPNAGYHYETEVTNAVTRRQQVHEDELLAESLVGQQILQLRQERENLLDTVWLATSAVQIRQLWSKVAEFLGDEQTRLQRDALEIPPVEE